MAKKKSQPKSSESKTEKPEFIITLTPDKYLSMIQENELVIIDFNASWCPPCRVQEKEFETNGKKLFEKFPNLKLCSMDTDTDKGLSTNLGIQYVPNIFMYYKGVYKALEAHGFKVNDLIPLISTYILEIDETIKGDSGFLERIKTKQIKKAGF